MPTERTPIPMEEISALTNQESAKGKKEKGGEDKGKSKDLIDKEENIEKNREDLAPIPEALKGMEEGHQASKKKKKGRKPKTRRSHK